MKIIISYLAKFLGPNEEMMIFKQLLVCIYLIRHTFGSDVNFKYLHFIDAYYIKDSGKPLTTTLQNIDKQR